MRTILLGNPGNRRVQLFASAFHAIGQGELEIVSWLDYLRDRDALRRQLSPGCRLRIESSGEDFEVEKLLLYSGVLEAVQSGYRRFNPGELASLTFQKGRILPLRQWYLGWKKILARIQAEVESTPGCKVMNHPRDIATMFDKARCHEVLGAAGVPVPRLLGLPGSYDELAALMEGSGCRRVFLKPCHSSSASGVIALERGPKGMQAFSPMECVRKDGTSILFNSLRVRRYTAGGEIKELVDAICRERCIAEAWFPKAGMEGMRFDLRVLVIGGRSAHTVVRQSNGPFTNLHLGNRRGNLDEIIKKMGAESWAGAMSVCESAAAAFPPSLYVAVDLLVSPCMRRFAVAEVNAFGDLLPNLLHRGMDTYTAELKAWRENPGHLAAEPEIIYDAPVS